MPDLYHKSILQGDVVRTTIALENIALNRYINSKKNVKYKNDQRP